MEILIITFGASQKTSSTVEMIPQAGDTVNVSYYKIYTSNRDVVNYLF